MAYLKNKKGILFDQSLRKTLNFFKEIHDFFFFFIKINKDDKKLIFYIENEGYLPYLEGLIEQLITVHKQSLCLITSNPYDKIFKRSRPHLSLIYSNKLLPFLMAFVNCKVFVMTLLDLNQFHLKRSVNPVHYIYVFHSIFSTHMVYRYGAFDYYDSILCCGPHHVKEIRKHEGLNGLRPKKLIEAGYYRLERIYNTYKKYIKEKSSSDSKGVILIAPSWGAANILESGGKQIVRLLLDAGYEVILRPHPEAIKRSPSLVYLYTTEFANYSRFILESSVSSDESLLKADVLISDYSGIVIEFAFGTERPVLFLDVPRKIMNPRFAELGIEPLELYLRSRIGVIVPPDKPEVILKEVSNLMASKEVYKKQIVELREQYVYSFGQSSEIGAQHIMDLLKNPN